MFKFTQTIILNSNLDELSGLPRWVADTTSGSESFNVKRSNNFKSEFVTAVYKRVAAQPKLATSELTMAQFGQGVYQLAVQIDYPGSQNSFYARPISYIKGKPLFYSFELDGTETATQVAEKVVKIVKHMASRFGDKWITVTNAAEVVTVTAIDEYQRFMKVAIQQYQPLDNPCACSSDCQCGWVDVLEGDVVQGREGFGTFTQITKDLRLPTAANTSWLALNQDERAVPGALYNQYTIEYVKPRGIQGTDAVGHLVTSSTLHVFYVKQDLVASWEAALASAGLTLTAQDKPTGYPA